jgi:hypothetical protein
MTYVKQSNYQDGIALPLWKLYDDNKPAQIYSSWREILEKILEFGTLPTILIYEKITEENNIDARLD